MIQKNWRQLQTLKYIAFNINIAQERAHMYSGILDLGSANNNPQAKFSLLPTFIGKNLL
jgi:hypothetical protein